jgi:hypothetical protein
MTIIRPAILTEAVNWLDSGVPQTPDSGPEANALVHGLRVAKRQERVFVITNLTLDVVAAHAPTRQNWFLPYPDSVFTLTSAGPTEPARVIRVFGRDGGAPFRIDCADLAWHNDGRFSVFLIRHVDDLALTAVSLINDSRIKATQPEGLSLVEDGCRECAASNCARADWSAEFFLR